MSLNQFKSNGGIGSFKGNNQNGRYGEMVDQLDYQNGEPPRQLSQKDPTSTRNQNAPQPVSELRASDINSNF
jgi:hypothetical protein